MPVPMLLNLLVKVETFGNVVTEAMASGLPILPIMMRLRRCWWMIVVVKPYRLGKNNAL